MGSITDDRLESVRIAPGNANSPVFLVFAEGESVSVREAKRFSRSAAKALQQYAPSADVDLASQDSNILLMD